MNEVLLIGNLGRDPEMMSCANGSSLCRVPIAVNRNYKDGSGEWQKRTSWFDLSCFGKTAELMIEKCTKGAKILVKGSLESYKGKDGNTKVNISVYSFFNLESSTRSGNNFKSSDSNFGDDSGFN